MKIIYISGRTGTGKSTALQSLCGEENIVYGNICAGMQTNGSSVIGIDEYRGEPIKERDLDYLKVVGVTHLYIATECTPDFDNVLRLCELGDLTHKSRLEARMFNLSTKVG